jgi:hypothetical protein
MKRSIIFIMLCATITTVHQATYTYQNSDPQLANIIYAYHQNYPLGEKEEAEQNEQPKNSKKQKDKELAANFLVGFLNVVVGGFTGNHKQMAQGFGTIVATTVEGASQRSLPISLEESAQNQEQTELNDTIQA